MKEINLSNYIRKNNSQDKSFRKNTIGKSLIIWRDIK